MSELLEFILMVWIVGTFIFGVCFQIIWIFNHVRVV